MSESKNIGINLDEKSIEILKEIDVTFRDSVVNIGLRMVRNTELFNTLMGKDSVEDVEEMVSLDQIEDNQSPKTKKTKEVQAPEPVKKPAQTWDSF